MQNDDQTKCSFSNPPFLGRFIQTEGMKDSHILPLLYNYVGRNIYERRVLIGKEEIIMYVILPTLSQIVALVEKS